MPTTNRAWFDGVSAEFVGFTRSAEFSQRVAVFVTAAASAPRPSDRRPRCLDLGCGPGELAVAFAARGFEVLGVDASPRMLDYARDAAARTGLPITFIQADLAGDLPALDFEPELVVCSSVLEYLDDPEALIERAAALLAPAGLLLASVPNWSSLARRQQEARYALLRRQTYVGQQHSRTTHRDLARMGERAGLELVGSTHFSAPRYAARWSSWSLIGTLTLVSMRKPRS
jgi:2-polyprenyl-3-methyl-5-hydroxy-6-metoxy-1,4-benzoquinol methylase